LRKIDLDCNGKMALLEYLTFKYSKQVKDVVNATQGGDPKEIKEAQSKLEAVQAALTEVQNLLVEQTKAVEALKKEEDSFNNQIKTLEQKSKDTTANMVAKNKAAAELAQLKQENPLPLRKAKITQEASLRKVEKANKEVEARMKEAEAYLEEVKKKGGAFGSIWWIERELKEAKKYLPQKKQ